MDRLYTVIVERLQGSFHCTDLGFSLFDAEFYALFHGVILKIHILLFFKIYPFFKMFSVEQLQMRLPIRVSHQNAAQFKIWPIILTDMVVVSSVFEPSEEIAHALRCAARG